MKRPPVTVHLHDDAETTIRAAAAAPRPRETGGILLGWWDDGAVVVRDAVEVPDPGATASSWSRDEQRAQGALQIALADRHHPWLGYVGDWHSHPAPCGPSVQDRRSIRRASRRYDQPLVLLVRRSDDTLDVVVAHRGRSRTPQPRRGTQEGQVRQ